MSAWMCSDKHIVFLVETVASKIDCFDAMLKTSGMTRRDLAQILIDENVASLVARYGDNSNAHELSLTDYSGVAESVRLDPVLSAAGWPEWMKAAASYGYQSCEDNKWHDSLAYHWLSVMQSKVAEDVVKWDKVVEFWSID